MSKSGDFVKKFYSYAQSSERYGVPALISLAQAGLESGWKINPPGFNLFGIKANKSWGGKRQLLTTREVHKSPNVKYPKILDIKKRRDGKYEYKVQDWFRKYDTPAGSFEDHARFLNNNPRYKNAFRYSNNPNQFAREIAAAGYATDPKYANKLIEIMGNLKKKAEPGAWLLVAA